MNSQTVLGFEIFQTNITFIRSMVMVDLEVLFHVSHMKCNFVAEKALDTLFSCYLGAILADILIEVKIFVLMNICTIYLLHQDSLKVFPQIK